MIPWILYTALGALAAWFAIEAFSRLWLARHGRFYSWTPHTRIHLDLLPDVFPHCDREARFEVNSRGERGAEPPPPGANAMHMLAMGGSAVECYMNDQVTQWPHRVQVELNKPEALQTLGTGQVHVGNIGRSLMTVEHLNKMIERVFDNYEQLDVVTDLMTALDPENNWMSRS